MKTHIIAFSLLALFITAITDIASALDTGLEVPPGTKIYVVVSGVDNNDEAKKIKLTKELIESKVNSQLLKNGIILGTYWDAVNTGVFLSVGVNVIKGAYSTDIQFKRPVFYAIGKNRYSVTGIAWELGGLGTYANMNKPILENLVSGIDTFSKEFLKTNPNYLKSSKPEKISSK
jgi:hypothetical protein